MAAFIETHPLSCSSSLIKRGVYFLSRQRAVSHVAAKEVLTRRIAVMKSPQVALRSPSVRTDRYGHTPDATVWSPSRIGPRASSQRSSHTPACLKQIAVHLMPGLLFIEHGTIEVICHVHNEERGKRAQFIAAVLRIFKCENRVRAWAIAWGVSYIRSVGSSLGTSSFGNPPSEIFCDLIIAKSWIGIHQSEGSFPSPDLAKSIGRIASPVRRFKKFNQQVATFQLRADGSDCSYT